MTRAIAISGALGSGKSTVARCLAQRLGMEFVSTGDLQRSIASRRRMSTLELNRFAEQDKRIDDEVDDVLRELAAAGTPVVVDSRMAWWFVPKAMSVHLTVAPEVAAERMHSRQGQAAEEYGSSAEALRQASDRTQSERLRFRSLYGVDTLRLRNYELVIDTTSAPAEEVADEIVATYGRLDGTEPVRPARMVLSPTLIRPTRHLEPDDDGGGDGPIGVGFSHPYYFVVDGHARLASAIRAGRTRIEAYLVGEGDEPLADGRPAREYFADAAGPAIAADWEAATGVRLAVPVTTAPASTADGD